uniref:glutathione transferase n=1 Tax=Amphora coffeiformis TaxID=265554 RepID=A0A7S3LBX3_9STRA
MIVLFWMLVVVLVFLLSLQPLALMNIQDRLKPDTTIKNEYGRSPGNSPRFIVGYWSIRGLGAPIRMLLSAAQIDHWVVMYDVKENNEGGWDKSTWLHDKEWLREEFPLINLPFLVDCSTGQVLSQTNAILSYLGRELDMFGGSVLKNCQCEELLCEIMDLRNMMVRFAYDTNESTAKEDAKSLLFRINPCLDKLERCLMKEYPNISDRIINRDELNTGRFHMKGVCHLVDGKLTSPDFHLWEMLDQLEGLCNHYELPSCLGTATTCSDQIDKIAAKETSPERQSIFPFLKEFHGGFIHHVANQAYAKQYNLNAEIRPDVVTLPYNNPYARFGSDPTSLGKYVRGQSTPWKGLGTQQKIHARVDTGIKYWDDEPEKGT